jgi:transcriptional regulator with XRE-family HTH domain
MDGAGALGRWMKQRRKALDLTQDDLARRVGCAAETIRKIEAGRLRPSRQIAELLANHLTIPAEERATFIALARSGSRTPAPRSPQVPYVGLNTYQENDAALFFGRETLVATLVDQVRDRGLLVVLGPSGSGKSSVVLAGLLPALKQGALPGSERWTYITLKPGPRPLESLTAAIEQLRDGDRSGDSAVDTLLADDDQALLRVAEQLGMAPDERLVLVIDQFEELWSLAPAEQAACAAFTCEQQQPFIRLLLAAATNSGSITIILTLRADFLHRAAEDGALARAIGQHDLVVGPMGADELRRAIERPAQLAGGALEPGLADELIAQVAGRPGALPLLEYTLLELWKGRRSDGMLTWETFHALGGVEGALAARADAILATHYSPAQQEQLRQSLVRLVQPGENVADTRRRIPLADLVLAGGGLDSVQALLKPLIDERLLVVSKMPSDDSVEELSAASHELFIGNWSSDHKQLSADYGQSVVEIAHEALIRAWPTFGRWIDEAREDLRIQLQIEAAAKAWAANDQSADFLWSGLQLARAAAWLDHTWFSLNERDQRFLDASREHEQARAAAEAANQRERERLLAEHQAEQRHARRLRLFLATIGGLLVAALIFALFAFDRRQAALRAESEAQQARAGRRRRARRPILCRCRRGALRA